jgi:hypothetical protein
MATPSGKSATPETVVTTVLVDVLITETWLDILFETYAKAPSAVTATSLGTLPTTTEAVAVLVAVLITETMLLPLVAT